MSNWVKGEDPMQITNKSTDRNAYNELQLRFVELVEEHKTLKQKHEDLIEKTKSMGASVSKHKSVLLIWSDYLTQLNEQELKELKEQYFVITSSSPQEIKTI
jgi:hypothetical protein